MTIYTKKMAVPMTSLLACIAVLPACSSGGGDSAKANPADVLTQQLNISGGKVVQGQPPAPTFTPGGPVIVEPTITEVSSISPGLEGAIAVEIDQIPLDTTSFNINIQFDKTTNQYISVTIDDPDLISDIASSGGTGTLSLPFSAPPTICDNLDDIQHQIQCYETVDLGGGSIVSPEAAQQMILACGNGTSGASATYFAEDPDSKFDLNNDPSDDLCVEIVGSQALINAENTRITNENAQTAAENGGVLPQDLEQSTFSPGSCPVKYSGQTCVVNDPVNSAVVTVKFTNLAPPENVSAFCAINGGTVQ